MINFRYHVVSLTAVFLALAVGLVLGSTVLNGPMLDALENRVNTLGRDNSQLREQVSFLEQEVDREQDFAVEAAPYLLTDALTDRRVAVVVLPNGEDYVEGVVDSLVLAGADITGAVTLTDKFTHPQHRRGELLDLSHRALPSSVDADSLPANSDGVETSAALLAAVLFDRGSEDLDGLDTTGPDDGDDQESAERDDGGSGDDGDDSGDGPAARAAIPVDDRQGVLSSYAAMDFLEFDDVERPAELVVVVAGLPDSDSDADQRNEAMLTSVSQFGVRGPVLIAASGVAGEGNVAAEVRSDPTLADAISTVDNVSAPQGQIIAALAAAEHLAGRVDHFGMGEGASALLPERSTP